MSEGQKNSIFNSLSNTTSNTVDNVKSTSKKVYEKSMESINSLGSRPEAIIGLIFVILFAIIIAYIMYNYITKTILQQSKLVVAQTKLPVLCNNINIYTLEKDLAGGNGIKRTYTFWIYMKTPSSTSFKNVLYIGNDAIGDRNIQIFLDKYKNKMFIRFKKTIISTDGSTQPAYTSNNLNSEFDVDGTTADYSEKFKEYMRQGVVIEYIPIQRWVHVGIVVNDYGNSQGGSIATYIDGELVGIANQGEKCRGLNAENKTYDFDKLDIGNGSNKNLVIGGNMDSQSGTVGFQGLLCKLCIFNYDLNDRDIYNNYNEGPIDGFMAKLGLGAYGVRSPIYRIE
jgi:hypothetical protein